MGLIVKPGHGVGYFNYGDEDIVVITYDAEQMKRVIKINTISNRKY